MIAVMTAKDNSQPPPAELAREFRARELHWLSVSIPLPPIPLPILFSVVAIPGLR